MISETIFKVILNSTKVPKLKLKLRYGSLTWYYSLKLDDRYVYFSSQLENEMEAQQSTTCIMFDNLFNM